MAEKKKQGKSDTQRVPTQKKSSSCTSLFLFLLVVIVLGTVGYFLVFDDENSGDWESEDFKWDAEAIAKYDKYLEMSSEELGSISGQAQAWGESWKEMTWRDPYMTFFKHKDTDKGSENKFKDLWTLIEKEPYATVFFYDRKSDNHFFGVKRFYSYMCREAAKELNFTACYAVRVNPGHEKQLAKKYGIFAAGSSTSVYLFYYGESKPYASIVGADGQKMYERLVSLMAPPCPYVNKWNDMHVSLGNDLIIARDYHLLLLVEEEDKFNEKQKIIFDQGKEYRQHFYIYQAHIDIAKGKNFEDKDGNQVEPKVGDVIYLRHEDKKNIVMSFKDEEDYIKQQQQIIIPKGLVMDIKDVGSAALEAIREYEEPKVQLIYDEKREGNKAKVAKFAQKLLDAEQFKGKILNFVSLVKKEQFNLQLSLTPELEYTKRLTNFLQLATKYKHATMKTELTSESAFEFLEKQLEEYDFLLQDEL